MKDTVRECAQCKDTYYSKNNSCVDCLISNCRTCEELVSEEGIVYTQCLICDDSYNIVKDFLLGSKDTTRNVCGWTREIKDCAVIDTEDRLNCKQCRDGFYFDSEKF